MQLWERMCTLPIEKSILRIYLYPRSFTNLSSPSQSFLIAFGPPLRGGAQSTILERTIEASIHVRVPSLVFHCFTTNPSRFAELYNNALVRLPSSSIINYELLNSNVCHLRNLCQSLKNAMDFDFQVTRLYAPVFTAALLYPHQAYCLQFSQSLFKTCISVSRKVDSKLCIRFLLHAFDQLKSSGVDLGTGLPDKRVPGSVSGSGMGLRP